MAAGLKTVLCTSATYRFSSVLTWRYGSVLHTRPFSSVQYVLITIYIYIYIYVYILYIVTRFSHCFVLVQNNVKSCHKYNILFIKNVSAMKMSTLTDKMGVVERVD